MLSVLLVGLMLTADNSHRSAAAQLSKVVGKRFEFVAEYGFRGRCPASNESKAGLLIVSGDSLTRVLPTGDVSRERLEVKLENIEYIRQSPDSRTVVLGDGELMIQITRDGSTDLVEGVGSAFFYDNDRIGVVPSFEVPIDRSELSGMAVVKEPRGTLIVDAVKITSDNEGKSFSIQDNGLIEAQGSVQVGMQDEWPNLNYSPIDSGEGVYDFETGRAMISPMYVMYSTKTGRTETGAFWVHSAFRSIVVGADMKKAKIWRAWSKDAERWHHKWWPYWVPFSDYVGMIKREEGFSRLVLYRAL